MIFNLQEAISEHRLWSNPQKFSKILLLEDHNGFSSPKLEAVIRSHRRIMWAPNRGLQCGGCDYYDA